MNSYLSIDKTNKKRKKSTISNSGSSKISTAELTLVLDDLKNHSIQQGMKENYHLIWQNFNRFVIQLDRIPSTWEEKTSLYCAFLVTEGRQSATIKSYVSAIKHKLTTDGYIWNDKLVLLSTITKACKLKNDIVLTRLPIGEKLVDIIIFDVHRCEESSKFFFFCFSAYKA